MPGWKDPKVGFHTCLNGAWDAPYLADEFSEPSDCPAGRRFATALWLDILVILVKMELKRKCPQR